MKHKKLFLSLLLIVGVVIVGVCLVFVPIQFNRLFERPTRGRCEIRLTRDILDRSLELGTQFLLNNQKPEGNFTYQYNWVHQIYTPGDNQVRQAGAMWGLALIYHDQPDAKVQAGLEKAMDFFVQHSTAAPDGRRYAVYPGDDIGKTGTVALCALTHIEYLRTPNPDVLPERLQIAQAHLDGYLEFLVSAQASDGRWHRHYDISDGRAIGISSPYYDGEALLALVKAAKYLGREDLRPLIIRAADVGYRYNVQEALQQHPDSNTTKGYYQWSSMAYFELATSGWQGTEKYGDYLIELADWMIDVHKTLMRSRNTAYAYEGIIPAYQMAVQRNDTLHIEKFACVIDTGLAKLTSWQVGGPLANKFIRMRQTDDPLAIGGVQNHHIEAPLRIDVTQHQMHAVILARRYVYR
jgi:hypothetical protein